MNALDVFLHDDRVGRLERHAQATLQFQYEAAWVEGGGAPVSLSLPVRREAFADSECRPFFAGLLPEGKFLRTIARAFGVSASNPFAVLGAIGGECAGAISLAPADHPPPRDGSPRWLDAIQLAKLVDQLPADPMIADDSGEGLRLSLAGAQEKLPVLFAGERIGITRGDPPSTHIIKLPDGSYADLVANEAFCLALARECGLEAVEATAQDAGLGLSDDPGDRSFLLVTRYDRVDGRRLHQEDLCQALGISPELKYQGDGGPSIGDCAALLRRVSSAPAPDVLALLDAFLFNFLIGNHDAHAKNYSLLLEGPRSPRLVPLYDLVSTAVYPGLHRKLAMKLGGENRPEYVRGRHLALLAAAFEVSPVTTRDRAEQLIERLADAQPRAREDTATAFRDQANLERILAVIEKRRKILSAAADELRN